MDVGTAPEDTGREAGGGCPVAEFGRLRETAAVVDLRTGDGGGAGLAGFMATRPEEVRTLLTDPRFRADADSVPGAVNGMSTVFDQLGLPPELDFLRRGLLTRDGADHARLRTLVSRAFTVRRVNALRPRVETITAELLDDVAAAGADGRPVDLVPMFAHPLPIAVICELVGVPEIHRPRWRELAGLLVGPDPERLPAVAHAVVDQVRALIAARREEPADDLITGLVRARSEDGTDGDRLTEHEMITMVFDLVTAGFETTGHVLSRGALALLTRPDQLAALRADPARWPRAVHELVRTCGPIPTSLPRYPSEDVELGGVTVPAGAGVLGGLLPANFDPRRYEDADRIDVDRDGGRGDGHVGFGHGAHYCLGAALARQEIEVGLRALTERFPDLRPAEPVTEPSQLGFQRLAALPVRVSRAGRG